MSVATGASPFKAYDIRGRVPEDLDAGLAFRLGRAFVERFECRDVVLGGDARDSTPQLIRALAAGIASAGARVRSIGLCGTEEVYFAAQQPGVDGGIMVTASHNPQGYNGMKLVRGGAVPVSGDSGLRELEARVQSEASPSSIADVDLPEWNLRPAYARYLLGQVAPGRLKPLRVLVDPGNGTAGLILRELQPHLPLELIFLRETPDPTFPHGIPNPLLPENRAMTAQAAREHGADFAVAWDGDFDRCFLFDEHGEFIEGYYLVGLLAQALLARHPGERIVHDPRLVWNTQDLVRASGGTPVQTKTGHAFIKERMRAENALYGGEMSAHHYFRSFAYCDNGMLPWLLIAQLLSERGRPLSSLVAERQLAYPVSGEINRKVRDVGAVLAGIEARYSAGAVSVEHIDGLSIEFPHWRFNVRGSNTEPVLRLNVETRGDAALMVDRTRALLDDIGTLGA
jgi:phosphomannomutase